VKAVTTTKKVKRICMTKRINMRRQSQRSTETTVIEVDMKKFLKLSNWLDLTLKYLTYFIL
jgi:Trm5-related predicted tRNA methylase